MTRLRAFALPALLFALVGVSGCFTFRRPEVVFRGATLGSFDANGTALEASFDVTNPNRYRIGVRRLTYRITVNGRDAGSGAADSEAVLEPKATTLVKLPLSIDFSKVKSAGLDFLFSGSLDYAVEGEVTFSTPIGVFQRPYRHAGKWER